MNYQGIFITVAVLSIALNGCQKAPDSRNVNGAIVAAQNTEMWTETEKSVTNNIEENEDIENVNILACNGEINFMVTGNIDIPEQIKSGILVKKDYSKEQLQSVFCPDAELEKSLEYGQDMEVWIEKEKNDSDRWSKKLELSVLGCSFSNYELDHKYISMDDGVVDESESKTLQENLMQTLKQLGVNYGIDVVKAYGEGMNKYYDYTLILKINDIACITNGNAEVQVTGDAKVSNEGIGSIWLSDNLVVNQSENIKVEAYNNAITWMKSCVRQKLINPSGTINITEIQLRYMIDKSDGEYSFHPVWLLRNIEDGILYNYAAFNAVNGNLEYYSGM